MPLRQNKFYHTHAQRSWTNPNDYKKFENRQSQQINKNSKHQTSQKNDRK